tara:strand:+ start:362 stop:556 length:195 start_codon:yes stop_codon:yes gene_type:complete
MDEDKRLTDDEFALLLDLLRRFSATDLDQFDHWRLKNARGDLIYIEVSRKPSHGCESAYRDIGI